MLRPLPIVLLIVYLLAISPPSRSEESGGLLELLSGEFALQEGRPDQAARDYFEAAQKSSDPVLAERAARVALLVKDATLARKALTRWQTLAPDAPGADQLAAILALREGDPNAAVISLKRLLAGPKDGWRLALQALASERQSAAAAVALTELIKRDVIPTDIDATLGFGSLAQSLSLGPTALSLAERVSEQNPEMARPWLWRSEIERQQGDLEAARRSLDRALALPELEDSLRIAAAAQMAELGEPLAAAEVLARGEQTDATLAGRAAYLARAEATDALAELYAELEAQPQTGERPAERLFLLGQLAELRKQPEQALDWYRKIRTSPMSDQAQLRIAVMLDEQGDTDAAIAHLQAYQQSESENGEALVNAYLLEAELLNRKQRFEQALSVYQRGLQVFEEDPDLTYARALAFERLDRVDEAIADLERLLTQDPDNADMLNALGYTLADRTDRLEEALDLITRALAQKPESPAIIDSMGWVLFRLGRIEEALVHLENAFKLQRDPEVAAHLGEALWVDGQKDEARSIWRLGAEIDPDNRLLSRTRERLDKQADAP